MTKLLRLLVSAGLLSWLFWRTDWDHVRQAFANLRIEYWLAALGLYVASQFISGLRWQLLGQALGFERTFLQHVEYYFIGMYFNLFLPTSVGGDVIRAWYLDGGSGKRLAAFLSVFVDRLSGLLVLLALACAAVALSPIPLPAWIAWSVWGTAAVAVLGLLSTPLVGRWTHRFDRARRLMEGTRLYLRRPRLILQCAVLSFAVQVLNILLVWILGIAIGVEAPLSFYWILVPMVSLLTLAPLSLNGMGVREGGTVLFLAPLNVPDGLAMSLSFLWFSVLTAASVFGGLVYLVGRFPRPKGQLDGEPLGGDSDQGRTGQPATSPRTLATSAGGPGA